MMCYEQGNKAICQFLSIKTNKTGFSNMKYFRQNTKRGISNIKCRFLSLTQVQKYYADIYKNLELFLKERKARPLKNITALTIKDTWTAVFYTCELSPIFKSDNWCEFAKILILCLCKSNLKDKSRPRNKINNGQVEKKIQTLNWWIQRDLNVNGKNRDRYGLIFGDLGHRPQEKNKNNCLPSYFIQKFLLL
ncbi:hypothetical protein DMUE_4364 [Dictyocoela muelleri]|nr:hypothetical protein DMUE_4364 [Dictyocoela muelleri]